MKEGRRAVCGGEGQEEEEERCTTYEVRKSGERCMWSEIVRVADVQQRERWGRERGGTV